MPPDPTTPLVAALAARLTETLVPVVRRAVEDALPAVVRRASLPPYLSKAELAKLTGWSPRKVDYLRERGRLPYVRVGRSIRFKTDDVERLLDEARVEARSTALLKNDEVSS